MLSYRHGFHAGNHADVLKHAVLVLLAQALNRKDTPWCYVDTHAGAGRYDLRSNDALKNQEHLTGITRLWARNDVPKILAPYLDAVRAINVAQNLRYYPGSPRIVRHLQRPGDRMVLSELHPQEIERLRAEFDGDDQVIVQHGDGYAGFKSNLPPRERRGLVLLDPAYERADEWERVAAGLQSAHQRWSTGVYALWYPILERSRITRFHETLAATGIRKMLMIELQIYPDDLPLRLNGSGMVIVNPPWQLDEQCKTLMPWLLQALAPEGQGGWQVEWLAAE